MKPQVKFVLFVLGVLFIASGLIAIKYWLVSPTNWWGFGISLFSAVVFYIGFVNTLMEIE